MPSPHVRPDRRLPPALAARAREFAEGAHAPVEARPAATVVLLRDRTDGGGLEAYLLRRVSSMAFAAGMHVFPGGTVDPRDVAHEVAWAGEPPARWAEVFGTDEPTARALVCAAVRETFEESGVLLAGADSASGAATGGASGGSSGGAGVDTALDTSGDDWERDRTALVDKSLAFAPMLERRGLRLRADLLRPWAHWITPEFEERRYDTCFYVAAVPDGQAARDVSGEADRVTWMRPSEAVARHGAGEMAMLPPTVVTLRELSLYGSVAEVLDAGWQREVRATTPRAVLDGDEAYAVLPGEPGYAQGVRA